MANICRSCAHLVDYGTEGSMHCELGAKPKENCRKFRPIKKVW